MSVSTKLCNGGLLPVLITLYLLKNNDENQVRIFGLCKLTPSSGKNGRTHFFNGNRCNPVYIYES